MIVSISFLMLLKTDRRVSFRTIEYVPHLQDGSCSFYVFLNFRTAIGTRLITSKPL